MYESLECCRKCMSHWKVLVSVRVTKMWWRVNKPLECSGECMSDLNVTHILILRSDALAMKMLYNSIFRLKKKGLDWFHILVTPGLSKNTLFFFGKIPIIFLS